MAALWHVSTLSLALKRRRRQVGRHGGAGGPLQFAPRGLNVLHEVEGFHHGLLCTLGAGRVWKPSTLK
jgi:hypothetical protein